MKQLSLGIVLSVIAIFVTAIILTIDTRTNREHELQNAVERALSETLDKASMDAVSGSYSDDAMASLATEAIRKNITVPENDKNFDLEINIISSDVKNGLLSANVKETYTNPNGKVITIETERTAVIEGESEKKAYKISYRYSKEDALTFNVPEIAAEYTLCEDDVIPVPKVCRFKGYDFKGFYDKESGIKYSADDLKNKKIDRSLNDHTLYLQYQSDGTDENSGKLITVRMKPALSGPGSSSDFNAHGKEGGSGGNGKYMYKFSYHYCKEHKAIELSVNIYDEDSKPYKNYRFHSASDNYPLNTQNPSLQNSNTLDQAISEMLSDLKITDYTVSDVKNLISVKFGYHEDGRKIWSYPLENNKRYYLVYLTAETLSIIPGDDKDSSIDALGAVTLRVIPGKGVASTYGSGKYPAGTKVKYGGTQRFGYAKPLEKEITLTKDTEIVVNTVPWDHRIHFDPNGGDGAPDDIIKVFGELVKIPVYIPNRDTYHFDYWSTVNQDPVEMGSDYTHDQDGGTVIMIAHWKSYISYDTTTGLANLSDKIASSDFSSDTMYDGGAVSVSKKPSVSYQGNDVSGSVIFVGWNTEKYGRGEWYAYDMNGSSGSFSYGGGDLKLYAQYRLKYDLFYDGNEQTEGDNFLETREDGVVASVSGSTFTFGENPFVKYNDTTVHDRNFDKDIPYLERYSFQGWSLNKTAYFNDTMVYHCENERKDLGDIKEAGIRDYLSECLATNPCDNIHIDNGYITVTTYAVWDKFPYVDGYDIGLIKDDIIDLSDDELKNMIIALSDAKSYDYDDAIMNLDPPKIEFMNFKKEDFIPQNDFGTTVCNLMVKDSAGNISYYQIQVYITSENFETSKYDSSKKAVTYKRFVDEENYSKSFTSYNTVNESVLSEHDRKNAHDRGGMEIFSKWLLTDDCKWKMKSAFS